MKTITEKEFVQWARDAGVEGHLVSIGDDGSVKEWAPIVVGDGFDDVYPVYLRASARGEYDAVYQLNGDGFRCVRKAMLEDSVKVVPMLQEKLTAKRAMEITKEARSAEADRLAQSVLSEVLEAVAESATAGKTRVVAAITTDDVVADRVCQKLNNLGYNIQVALDRSLSIDWSCP